MCFYKNEKTKELVELSQPCTKGGWKKIKTQELENLIKDKNWTAIEEDIFLNRETTPQVRYFKNNNNRTQTTDKKVEAKNLINSGFWQEISKNEYQRLKHENGVVERAQERGTKRTGRRKLAVACLMVLTILIVSLIILERIQTPANESSMPSAEAALSQKITTSDPPILKSPPASRSLGSAFFSTRRKTGSS